jgi:electron transport complex protein RnfE
MSLKQDFTKGIIKENPVFVLLLGMCPTLGVTTSGINGLGMGMATAFVLVASSLAISLLRNLIPAKVRIPAFIVVIATFVTVVKLVMEAYLPELFAQLGLFIPLIVVNCVILGRAEAFASKNGPIRSILDGLGSGIGFTLALTLLGLVREILGSGSFFDMKFVSADASTMIVFILPPGAFIVLGFLIATVNKLKTMGSKV